MKKQIATRRKATAKPVSDLQSRAEEIIKFLEGHAKKIDKTTLAKYVAIAALVIYGIRRSNVLGSLTISLLTGAITKFMADKIEGASDFAEVVPAEGKG